MQVRQMNIHFKYWEISEFILTPMHSNILTCNFHTITNILDLFLYSITDICTINN